MRTYQVYAADGTQHFVNGDGWEDYDGSVGFFVLRDDNGKRRVTHLFLKPTAVIELEDAAGVTVT